MKVVALSKYGFKVDSLKNDWEKVDKCLLNREIFKNLEKGSEIEVVERNKKGFIIDFKLIPIEPFDTRKLLDAMVNGANEIKANIDSRSRDILKGQCLNIACNAVFMNRDIGFDMNRDKAIKLAQKLFIELEQANYYGW